MVKREIKKFSYGIMQGRLVRPLGRGIQFFPFAEWEQEFKDAADLNLDEIEFIFDLPHCQKNPLWTDAGLKKIQKIVRRTQVKVNHVCADYFMRLPFWASEAVFKKNLAVLKKLLTSAAKIGAKNIEIPLVDTSSMKNAAAEKTLIKAVESSLPQATSLGLTISLETDYPPEKLLKLLQKFKHPGIGANYDSGNSSGLGYDSRTEIETLNAHIKNIHIKDRLLGDGTVALGTGSADFTKLFRALQNIGYQGSFILQAARGEEGQEKTNIGRQLKFLKAHVARYLRT